jgi:hypothetical protein
MADEAKLRQEIFALQFKQTTGQITPAEVKRLQELTEQLRVIQLRNGERS